MALSKTGALIQKFINPSLVNPCFIGLGPVHMQVRYAARKGYREKAKKAKMESQRSSVEVKKPKILRQKFTNTEKTVNLKKPEPPSDDVIMRDNFNYVKYTLSEAVKLHREYHHPTVYNNPCAPVSVKIEINMTGKSQFQFIKPFSGIASIPHPFVISSKKEVLVLCNQEDVSLALSCGATVAGGEEIINKIKEGIIQPSLYDYVICHINFFPNISVIRSLLKNQLPKAKQGTLTNDLKSAIHRFLYGVKYSCIQLGAAKDTGFIVCSVGQIGMELEQLEENLKTLIKTIEKHRPPRPGNFINWIWCSSPPSDESFSLDLSKYVDTQKVTFEEDEEEEEEEEEKAAKQKLKVEYEEKALLEKLG